MRDKFDEDFGDIEWVSQSELSIKTKIAKRKQNGWDVKNAARYKDPKFKQRHANSVSESNKAKAKDPKWLAANRAAQEKTRKPIHTPYGVFNSKGDAMDAGYKLGIDFGIKLKTHPHLYYYLEDGPGKTTYEKVYYMDFNYGNKLRTLHKQWCEINKQQPSANVDSWFRRMCKQYPDQYYVKTEPKREWGLEK